jgi:hypothetical protein
MIPTDQNPTATPLAAPGEPQNSKRKRQDGKIPRHDGFAPVPSGNPGNKRRKPEIAELAKREGTGNPVGRPRTKPQIPKRPIAAELECARVKCKKLFSPRRPNQKHCSEHCRKLAHLERKENGVVAPLVAILEDLADQPNRLRALMIHQNVTIDDMKQPHQKLAFTLYSRILELAERAASAVADHRKK